MQGTKSEPGIIPRAVEVRSRFFDSIIIRRFARIALICHPSFFSCVLVSDMIGTKRRRVKQCHVLCFLSLNTHTLYIDIESVSC